MADMTAPVPDGTEISPKESRHLSTALIVYGVVGVLLAIASIIALIIVNGRIGNVSDNVTARIDRIERTLSATSDSLDSAATSALGFSNTLGTTSRALSSSSNVVGALSPVLVALGKLGPLLGSAGDKFESVGQSMSDLAPTLDELSTNLAQNQQQLENTSASAQRLADELDNVQVELQKGTIETRVSEGFNFLKAGLIAMTIWLALPAAAALFIGIWLRRAVAPAA